MGAGNARDGAAAELSQCKLTPSRRLGAPALEPDGVLQSSPTRVNTSQVDLNRNFPTRGWQTEAPEH